MARIQLSNVTRRWHNFVAVDNLSLDIADREFLVLLGPSGCGKTTTMRMIAGLEDISAGEIRIGERLVNALEPKDRDISMVFQSYGLYPNMTVYENIRFPLKVRNVPKAERAKDAELAAASLGLTEYLNRKPGQLSGGQRQRVALARAIVRRPAVFCMDEPLSNLDAKLRAETRAELVALHRRLDSTFIYVTHDQVEAMTMGSHVAVMSRGRIEQIGSPQEVYARPASVFVAQFIGTPPMNVLPAGSLEPGELLVGVRPEHLELDPTSPFRVVVDVVEHLGHETLLNCHLTGAQLSDSAARVMVRLDAEADTPSIGDDVGLTASQRHRHRFDPVTTKRVDT